MRLLCSLLLLFLVAAGPVAALAAGPGSAGAVVQAAPVANPAVATIHPSLTKMATVVVTAATVPVGQYYISSTPAGAKIFIDDQPLDQVTPVNLTLRAGPHTLRLTLAGYYDHIVTIRVFEGIVNGADIVLQPIMNSGAVRKDISAVSAAAPALRLNRTLVSATVTTPVPGTVCLSGEHCLTPADANLYYQQGWNYKVNEICGYVLPSNQAKYCTSGTPSPITSLNCLSGEYCLTDDEADATLAAGWHRELESMGGVLCGWGGSEYEPLPKYCIQGSPKMISIQPGAVQSIAVQSPVSYSTLVTPPETVIPITSATKEAPGAQQQDGIIESFLGFFRRLFNPMPQPDYSNLT